MKMSKVGRPGLWRSLIAVSGVVLTLSIGGSVVTNEWSGYINKYLGISGTKIVDESDGNEDPIHFKSDFNDYKSVMNSARTLAKKVQAEGTVLMTNKNNALPFAKNSKVTFFGYNTVDMALGGTGSGGVSPSADRKIDLVKACENKIDMNKTIYDFYQQKYDDKVGFVETTGWGGTTLNFRTVNKVNEISADDFTQEVKNSFDSYNDVAIFVMTRIGGEGSDLNVSNSYLSLSDEEKSVLQAIKDGNFKKRIVLVNTFNTPELGWLDDYNIDACLYIGGPGEVGMDAVTDILTGDINPSGHLADTYAYSVMSAPSMQNFGNFVYANADSITNKDSQKYLMYNEGIYVGYRYYETRYEDSVLNQGNATASVGVFNSSANTWNYAQEVQFPFGYGLSYSTFTQKLNSVNVDWANKKATVKVTVNNTSSNYAGKDVVEVYAQAPMTDNGVEKSAIQLCGFAKTDEIQPGKSQGVTIEIDLRDIASYDYQNYKTYIMDEGDYYFAIGNDAHDALNNILALKGKNLSDGMTSVGDAGNAVKANKASFDKDEYRLSKTNASITNQFETADINYYTKGTSDEVKYLSRKDWNGTWPKNMTGFSATQKMIEDAASYYSEKTDGTTSPSAYQKGDSDTSSITYGAEKKYNLAMMIGVDYDDPAWDELLNQLTLDDYYNSTKQGREAIESVGLSATTAVDGPSAWTKSKYITDYKNQYNADKVETTDELMVSYPTETVTAGTWNVPLTYELGKSFGEEGLWGGGVGWYGPAANIHRTPFGGRNFEYFSEDGFISGKLAESEVQGAMSKGTIPYLKHFFGNDQETNRIGVCTFMNEQSIREIYLRSFQYAFETTGENDKSCSGVMGAFNRLGMVWTGHHQGLWKEVMEKEWGFKGNVTTDFGQKQGSLMEPQLAYEAGTTMFCTSGAGFANYLKGIDITKDYKIMSNMREAIHRNLYNFANSAAMNGMTSSSKVVPVRVWYQNALLGLEIGSGIILGLSLLMLGLQLYFISKEKE
mgnify:FL=1